MEEDKQKSSLQAPEPFDIVYNFRHHRGSPDRPRRKTSACQKIRPLPEFTMRTRKMTADLQLKQDISIEDEGEHQDSDVLCPEPPMQGDDSRQFLLKNEEELEMAIPLSPEMSNGMEHNLGDNSQMSTFNKLEQALFGFKLEECMEQE